MDADDEMGVVPLTSALHFPPSMIHLPSSLFRLPSSVFQPDMDTLPPNRLGVGERAVIAYVRSHAGYSAGLDDRQARLLAERMGLTVVGTIGVLLRAKEADLIPAVRPLLDTVQSEGFRLGIDLYQAALRLAGEGEDGG